jgi:regulator of vacuolar morphogenesis
VLNTRAKKDDRGKEEDWLDIHKQAKILLQDARRHLSRRSTATTIKDQHSASAAAKRCLVLVGTKVTTLQAQLSAEEREAGRLALGEGELRRRRDLIRELNTEILGLERLSQSIATQRTTLSVPNSSDEPGNPLFAGHSPTPQLQQSSSSSSGGAVSSRRVFGVPQETERTKGLDNHGVLQLQQTIMQEQEDHMDDILHQVRRTKGLAQQINEELVSQIDLLDGLEDDVDRVDSKIKRAQRRADKLS